MDTEKLDSSILFKDLRFQDSENKRSIVSSLCSGVDVQDVFPDAVRFVQSPEESEKLKCISHLLNWSYGYQSKMQHGKPKRNAPSAGGRYPTEVLCIIFINDTWLGLIYDFSKKYFLTLDLRDNDEFQDYCNRHIDRESIYLCMLSVMWRTVHRYGVRGYRYCLIDAACVASNVYEVSLDANGIPEFLPSARLGELESVFGLPKGVHLVAGIEVTPTFQGIKEWAERGVEHSLAYALFKEEPPCISPCLDRVDTLHRKVKRSLSDVSRVHTALDRKERTPYAWVNKRYSAKSFDGMPFSKSELSEIADEIERYIDEEYINNGIHLCAAMLAISKDGLLDKPGVFIESQGKKRAIDIKYGSMQELAEAVFQNQKIVALSSVLLILGVPDPVDRFISYGALNEYVLSVGYWIAHFHRYAVNSSKACTAIGGFSDSAVTNAISEKNFFPIMAFQFGNEAEVSVKVDAQPWLAHASGKQKMLVTD